MGDVNSQEPGQAAAGDRFSDDVMNAWAAQAAKAVPADRRTVRDVNRGGPDLTLDQAKQIVLDAMHDFDPALGARAEKIFAEGFDAAAKKAGGPEPDWEKVPKADPPARWMLQQVAEVRPGELYVQRSLAANSPATQWDPANPNDYSVIQYKFDGKIGALVVLAHELGHSIADDNLRNGGHSGADNPKHMHETQAYFTQNLLYDYIRKHPELDQKYPGIAKASEAHFAASLGENLRPFAAAKPDPEKLQDRPASFLGGLALFESARDDKAQRAGITAAVMQAKGPATFNDTIRDAGVKTPRDLEAFTGRAVVNSATHPPLPRAAVATPVVNVVIDAGDWDPKNARITRAEHDAEIRKINDSVETLRKQGIPTIFVMIGNDTGVHPGSQPRDPGLIKRLHMTELNIQPGDTIVEKRSMSSFVTLDDIKNSPALEKYIAGQRQDGANYKEAKWGTVGLGDVLESMGAQHVTLMGSVAQYCITDTALDAARRGLGVTVLTDTVSGWNDKSVLDKVVMPGDPKVTAKQVVSTLDEIRADPEKRGIEKTDTAVVEATKKIKLLTVDRFLKSPAAQMAVKPVAPVQQSKFLAPKQTAPQATVTAPAAPENAPPPAETPQGPAKGNAVQEHGGKAMGVATIGVDLAEHRYGRALTDATMQLSLSPETYEAAAKLAGETGSVAKLLGEFSKKIPVAGAAITAGFVLYEVGADMYDGKFGKAGAALAAGTAETSGNIFGFGVGDLARETVREGVVVTAGEEYAPNKSGLRDLGERAYSLGEKVIASGGKTGTDTQKCLAAPPKLTT